MKKLIYTILCLAAFFSFTSCMSTRIDFTKKTELYHIEIETPGKQYFTLKLYGELTENILEVTQVYWFDNWANGWTEVLFMATGTLKINPAQEVLRDYEVLTPVVLEYPERAKIRFKDTYIEKQEATKALNNRLSRIESINEVIAQKFTTVDYETFKVNVGAYLFPEKYTAHKYSYLDVKSLLNKDSEKILGDGTYWNVDYTKSVYPEYMWETRNTGTLYRDWEEGMDLIYIIYSWNTMFGEKHNG